MVTQRQKSIVWSDTWTDMHHRIVFRLHGITGSMQSMFCIVLNINEVAFLRKKVDFSLMEQMGHPLYPPLCDNVQACDQDKLRFWGFF